jgi:hypothetical protein
LLLLLPLASWQLPEEITKIEKQPPAKYKDAGIAELNAAIGELNLRKFIVVLGRE